MIAKQMDVRSNIRKYFDMAYEGEAVIVPRKADRNVVIISEAEYNRMTQALRTAEYAKSYGNSRRRRSQADDESVRKNNMEKLERIRAMKKNWNGNGAPAFPAKLISRVRDLVEELFIQPEIFPTAMRTIQLEYDNARRDHMEIEIGDSDTAEVFIVRFNGEELYEDVCVSAGPINERVAAFYG